MKVHRSIYHVLMMVLLSTSIMAVLSAQEYDYAEDYGDYQQGGAGDYYGGQDDGYYAQEEDTLYHDYARHQQDKAGL
jgi:hypothetical protein